MTSARDWIEMHLPDRRTFIRFVGWGLGRLTFSGLLLTIQTTRAACKLGVLLTDMSERSVQNLLKVYDQLPYAGTLSNQIVEAKAIALPLDLEVITDLFKMLEGKHALIVGDTGTGKSTLAQYLAYQIGGEVTVYDPDSSPEEWEGLNVVGRKGDFEAIGEAMATDLEELQRRIELRGEQGDKALAGMDSVTIAEEFPLLKEEVPIASEWLVKHARRGRKPKRFIIALAQDDNVKTLGIEGEGGVRKCFRMVRLGKFAIAHAKSLKDEALVEWLKAGQYRCMVDDSPCQLPDMRQYKMVMPRLHLPAVQLPMVTAETPTEQEIQPLSSGEEPLAKALKTLLDSGFSESRIIKDVLGCQGARYQQGKALLHSLTANKSTVNNY